jgi:hypothetical protein
MSFSLNKLILSLHLRRYIKRLKSKAETMLQQEEDEENETLAPLPSKSSLRIHVSSPNGSETSEKTNGCNNKKSRKKRHHRSRTFSTPNSPSVSILQLEAQNKTDINRQAVQTFRKHVARVKSVDLNSSLFESLLSLSPSPTPATSTEDINSNQYTFLIEGLQRAKEEILELEEKLSTAARLGEQLIAYNEELEETVSNLQLQDKQEKQQHEQQEQQEHHKHQPTPSFELNEPVNFLVGGKAFEEDELSKERAANSLLKKRLSGVTGHLHDAEQNNAILHSTVSELESRLLKLQRKLDRQEVDRLKTPSPTIPNHMISVTAVANAESEMNKMIRKHTNDIHEKDTLISKLKNELKELKINIKRENKEKLILIDKANEKNDMIVNDLTEQLAIVTNERLKWEEISMEKDGQIKELKNILDSKRTSSPCHPHEHRHRLSSSLDRINELKEKKNHVVVGVDKNRASRPKNNDPYKSFTDYRKLLD